MAMSQTKSTHWGIPVNNQVAFKRSNEKLQDTSYYEKLAGFLQTVSGGTHGDCTRDVLCQLITANCLGKLSMKTTMEKLPWVGLKYGCFLDVISQLDDIGTNISSKQKR